MKTAVIALGSNLNRPEKNVQAAVAALKTLPHSRFIRASSLWRTAPVGYLNQPDFINAAALIETALAAEDLLRRLQSIEQDFGRVRTFADAPRTLDLDIIDYNGETAATPSLILPHPRAHERAFVLAPLAEIAPDYPLKGRTVREYLAELPQEGIFRLPENAESPL